MSSNFALFVLARIVGGASKGNVSLSLAVVADVATEKTRGKGMVRFVIKFRNSVYYFKNNLKYSLILVI
jgi:predicted MFS family arabinose efflux permease